MPKIDIDLFNFAEDDIIENLLDAIEYSNVELQFPDKKLKVDYEVIIKIKSIEFENDLEGE